MVCSAAAGSWGELVGSPPILTTSEISLAQLASIRRPRPSLLLLLLFVFVNIEHLPTDTTQRHELAYLGVCFLVSCFARPLPKPARLLLLGVSLNDPFDFLAVVALRHLPEPSSSQPPPFPAIRAFSASRSILHGMAGLPG